MTHGQPKCPKGYGRQQCLKWLYAEIDDLLRQYPVKALVVKGTEGIAPRGTAFVSRVEHEAIVFLVGALHDVRNANRKVKSTLAKDLGLKGRARYLKTDVDGSLVPGMEIMSEPLQEAVLAAWSELP